MFSCTLLAAGLSCLKAGLQKMDFLQGKNKKWAMWMTALLLPSTGIVFLFTLHIAVTAQYDSKLFHNFLPGSHLFPLILLAACISVLLNLLGFSLDRSCAVVTAQFAPHRSAILHLRAPWYIKLGFYVVRLLASLYPFGVAMQTKLWAMAFPNLRHFWYIQGLFVMDLVAYAIISAEVAVIVCYLQLRYQDHNWW